MDEIDTYIGYGLLAVTVAFFVPVAITYFRYGQQLKKGFLELGMKWPLPSPSELNKELREDFFGAISKVYASPFRIARIIFFMRTSDPRLSVPIRGIRRCLLALILFPILVAFILLILFASLQK